MNALPMNLMVTPPNAAAPTTPAPGATPRDGSEGGFAHCLEQAAGREPTAPDAADKSAPARDAADAGEAPDATDAGAQPAAARGARRAPGANPSTPKAEALPNAAPATLPLVTDATAAKAVDTEDVAAGESAGPSTKHAAPELAALLPGWTPPPPAPPVAPAVAVAVPAAAGAATDTAATASIALSQAGAPAEPKPANALARQDDTATSSNPLTLPLPAAAAPAQATASAKDMPTVAQAHVAPALDSPAFAPALATQVRWLVRDGLQHAQLSLNPAEMGPVTVQIVLDGREARIDFRADLAATRNAIEASLPVLAAALDDSGLRLAGGGVHDGQASRQGAGQQGWHGAGQASRLGVGGESGSAQDAAGATAPRAAVPTRGLVDLVA